MARGRLVALKKAARDCVAAKLPEAGGFERAPAWRPVKALGLLCQASRRAPVPRGGPYEGPRRAVGPVCIVEVAFLARHTARTPAAPVALRVIASRIGRKAAPPARRASRRVRAVAATDNGLVPGTGRRAPDCTKRAPCCVAAAGASPTWRRDVCRLVEVHFFRFTILQVPVH